MGELLQVKDIDGNTVYMCGVLPDGTYGVVVDEAKPFTDEELADLSKFRKHMSELSLRVDEEMWYNTHD